MNNGEIKLVNGRQCQNAGGIATRLSEGHNIDGSFNTANVTLNTVKDGMAGN